MPVTMRPPAGRLAVAQDDVVTRAQAVETARASPSVGQHGLPALALERERAGRAIDADDLGVDVDGRDRSPPAGYVMTCCAATGRRAGQGDDDGQSVHDLLQPTEGRASGVPAALLARRLRRVTAWDSRAYQRKRDFAETPEPAGKRGDASAGRSFVVQKHAATRLHYDFRLELDGVLKSWAVPKGPSLDPADKRLAMQTEDHPVEYGGFEGVIPEGEYGGGTVLLWDRGTWEPIDDPRPGRCATGKLEFRLHGEKLRGAWALVEAEGARRAREAARRGSFKEKDEARPRAAETTSTSEPPESVATGRDLDEIARDRDRVWHSNRARAEQSRRVGSRDRAVAARRTAAPHERRARRAALPASVEPQLATLVDEPPAGDEWLHEMKFDGYRILARLGRRARAL